MTAPPSPWFVRFLEVDKPKLRLFCFPYAGGGAAAFRSWPALLPDGVELWAIRLPGREIRFRETPFHRMSPLVDAASQELEPYLDRPYAIFGHSLGAVTAFEVARRLESLGSGPNHVFVSAHRAPFLPQVVANVHLAPDDVILQRMRRYGGTPEAFYSNTELVSAMLPNLRCDFALSETYRFTDSTPLRSNLTAFGGIGDETAPEAMVEEWQHTTEGKFRHRVFEGGHFYWTADPTPLLNEINADLRDSFVELAPTDSPRSTP